MNEVLLDVNKNGLHGEAFLSSAWIAARAWARVSSSASIAIYVYGKDESVLVGWSTAQWYNRAPSASLLVASPITLRDFIQLVFRAGKNRVRAQKTKQKDASTHRQKNRIIYIFFKPISSWYHDILMMLLSSQKDEPSKWKKERQIKHQRMQQMV